LIDVYAAIISLPLMPLPLLPPCLILLTLPAFAQRAALMPFPCRAYAVYNVSPTDYARYAAFSLFCVAAPLRYAVAFAAADTPRRCLLPDARATRLICRYARYYAISMNTSFVDR